MPLPTAHKCAISGELHEGAGIMRITVPVSETLRYVVQVQVSDEGKENWRTSTICEAEADKLKKALTRKPAKAKED